MKTSVPWGWIALAAFLLLLPGPAGRLILDLVGGVTLLLVLLPLLAGAAALVGWQLIRRRLQTCAACGFSSFGTSSCPACGAPMADSVAMAQAEAQGEQDARSATITVDAIAVNDSTSPDGGASP